MSAIKLNSSGGGSITISPASTASTLTLTAPAQTGTIGLDGPAFSAYLATNQTGINMGIYTKVQIATKEFDTANCYNTSTFRFTPTLAGYYQINANINAGGSTNTTELAPIIYKNGAVEKFGNLIRLPSPVVNLAASVSTILYLNGSTDYVEFYVYGNGSGTLTAINGASVTYFQAALIRGA